MAHFYLDLTEDTILGGGEVSIDLSDRDSLHGCGMAIKIADGEIVLTIAQAVTLFDMLDGWLNGGTIHEVGAIRRRLHEAIDEVMKDYPIPFRKLFTPIFTKETFVHQIEQAIRFKGLRFRLKDDEPLSATHRYSAPIIVKTEGES